MRLQYLPYWFYSVMHNRPVIALQLRYLYTVQFKELILIPLPTT